MKKIVMTCDACESSQEFFEHSGLYGWCSAKLSCGNCHWDLVLCACCYGRGREVFKKTLWERFLDKIGANK